MSDMSVVETKMLERMKATPTFTFGDLHRPFNDKFAYRLADRLLQRERKAGNIRQVKHGVWEAIAAAKE